MKLDFGKVFPRFRSFFLKAVCIVFGCCNTQSSQDSQVVLHTLPSQLSGLPAVSVQWGPWAEVGMAARAGTTESGGYLRLDPTASLQATGLSLPIDPTDV